MSLLPCDFIEVVPVYDFNYFQGLPFELFGFEDLLPA